MKHITGDRIEAALSKIAAEIAEQCLHGKQNEGLPDGVRACGQFYGGPAKNRGQRGIHGSAAAASVLLSEGSEASLELGKGLIKYVSTRETYDTQNPTHVQDDSQNIVKQSEILRSLNLVPSLSSEASKLALCTVETLTGSLIQAEAWPFFVGEKESSTIPTAYAVLALAPRLTQEKASKATAFLLKRYAELNASPEGRTTRSLVKRILIMYALTFCGKLDGTKAHRDLASKVRAEWRQAKPEMAVPSEQTIDYYKDARNFYMRVPWQLYLLASVAKLTPQVIYSLRFQRHLEATLASVETTGFKYGSDDTSTRTNAILYGFLKTVRDSMAVTPPSVLFRIWDHSVYYLNLRFVKGSLTALWTIGGPVAGYYYNSSNLHWGGPLENLAVAAWGSVVTLLAQWTRKSHS